MEEQFIERAKKLELYLKELQINFMLKCNNILKKFEKKEEYNANDLIFITHLNMINQMYLEDNLNDKD